MLVKGLFIREIGQADVSKALSIRLLAVMGLAVMVSASFSASAKDPVPSLGRDMP